MKKTLRCFFTLILMGMLLTGCIPVGKSERSATPLASFSYDPDLIDAYTKEYIKPDEKIYRLVLDAVHRFETSVPLPSHQTITTQAAEAISAAVFARLELPFLRSITLSPDGTAIDIQYRAGFTKASANEAKNAYIDQMQYILAHVASPQYTDVENVIAIYRHFSKCTYNEAAEDVGAYGIMVHSEGICTGYAYALRDVLEQLHIPSYLAFSTDESHVWNIVQLGDSFYHVDATWESRNQADPPTMHFFGMTDAQRKADFDGWYGGGNSNYAKFPLPACTDTTFHFLRDAQSATADLANHMLFYTGADGRTMRYHLLTGENVTVDAPPASTVETHTLRQYDALLAEATKISEAFQALPSAPHIAQAVESLQQQMRAHLQTLEAAYEQANMDGNFSEVFSGDVQRSYGKQLQNADYRKLVEITYENGYLLKKDAGYVYPEIDPHAFDAFVK